MAGIRLAPEAVTLCPEADDPQGPTDHPMGTAASSKEEKAGNVAATSISQQAQKSDAPITTTVKPDELLFLIVNPSSGGNKAKHIVELGIETFKLSEPREIFVYLYDITKGEHGNKNGFKKLKEVCDASPKGESIRIVVAGGDGTVMWCLSELEAHHIDTQQVAIGVLPYGTGNDFARSLSWAKWTNSVVFDKSFATFKKLLGSWMTATVVPYDIWEIEVDLHDDGFFKQVDSKTKKKKLLTDVIRGSQPEASSAPPPPVALIKKKMHMANYFSIGVESRIGMGFDRHRAKTQMGNKCVYLGEGLKALFKKTPRISDVLKTLEDEKSPVALSATMQLEAGSPDATTASGEGTTVIRPDVDFKTKYASLIAINIPSFSGGCDIWGASKQTGMKDKSIAAELLKTSQQVGDGKIEWLSFPTSTSMGAEQMMKGHGRRLHQGSGPFKLAFKDHLPGEGRYYMQVDGEFFQINKPKLIIVKHSQRIQVLKATPTTAK